MDDSRIIDIRSKALCIMHERMCYITDEEAQYVGFRYITDTRCNFLRCEDRNRRSLRLAEHVVRNNFSRAFAKGMKSMKENRRTVQTFTGSNTKNKR